MPGPRLAIATALLALVTPLAATPARTPAAPVVTAAVTLVAAAPTHQRPTVIGTRLLGHSVQGRRIMAWHLGTPGRGVTTVVLIAAMHGDETAPTAILTSLRDGPPVDGLDLWVVPTYNPDGVAAHTRQNADGVDPNRNYPYEWTPMSGATDSGSGPASEPETRAMMRFLSDVRPDYVLSFHQPLNGVDTDVERPRFARRVARALHLPTTRLDCGGQCHGTMTEWYDHAFQGFALTVEYGDHPGRRRMHVTAPRQLRQLFGVDEAVEHL